MSQLKHHKLYLAIGSNLGDRKKHILDACNQVEEEIGLIINSAPVYLNAAADFEGGEFYNSVILVHTILSPLDCLNVCKSIETSLGRAPKKSAAYENRCIDLDIILYDDLIVNENNLTIPHKKTTERNFVLQPLLDIDSTLIDPSSLIAYSEHLSALEKMELQTDWEIPLSRKRFPIHNFDFIAIEGNIGSGKTSLTKKLAQDFNGNEVLERFKDNPFLPLFYGDQERYSFPLEMSFLADRYQQLSDEVGQHDLFTDLTISDYYVVKSLIFSRVTLDPQEYELYRRLFYLMYKELTKPDLYVYLYQTEERLLENIKKRGREYEQDIKVQYLNDIHTGYVKFIKSQTDLPILIIDVSDIDFVASHRDYIHILEEIFRYQNGQNLIN